MEGHAHADAGVLPGAHRKRIVRDHCTFVDVLGDGRERRYENTFVVSSWAPVARGTDATMLVSYNAREPRSLRGDVRAFSNRGAHPDLFLPNLLRARRLRRHQGRSRLYFCGSYTTPEDGHDLSLLSGLIVANAIGAAYPFERDAAARADFERLRSLMIAK